MLNKLIKLLVCHVHTAKVVIVGMAICLLIMACAPQVILPKKGGGIPSFDKNAFISFDQTALAYKKWLPENKPIQKIVIALHGFNDYSNFFEDTGNWLIQFGIASYAYDQRGFGDSPHNGFWAGSLAMQNDLKSFIQLIKRIHPTTPIYVLGESMGGAVVMTTMTQDSAPKVNGLILVAPAVWGKHTMPWYQRWALNVASYTVPWVTLTGRGLKIKPSDNIPMLKKLGKDPLIIKETRIDAIYGLSTLMGEALKSASELKDHVLIMYGERDEIIPKRPTKMMLDNLPILKHQTQRIALYEEGYHMLLRDLNAQIPQQDILSWINAPQNSLPSKADTRPIEGLLESH